MADLDASDNNSPDNAGSGDGDLNDGGGSRQDSQFKAITSQEDFDKAVQRRIARVEGKYKGFDELKAKAEQFDKLEAERGSDLEKLTRRAEKAEAERDALNDKLSKAERMELVRDIADDLGLPKKLVKRVQGDTEEDIRADIEDLLEGLPSSSDSKKSDDDSGDKKPPSQKPKPKTTFTATGDESDSGLAESADDILKDVNGL